MRITKKGVLIKMELLTQEDLKRLPKLGATDGQGMKAIAYVKFFAPGFWTWYATQFDGEDTFFGLVRGFEYELGYFSLKELKSIRGLGVERDMYFKPATLEECKVKNL